MGGAMSIRWRHEADAAAHDAESRLASLASDHLSVPVAVVQANSGLIAYTNRSWNSLFGYREREAISRHVSAVHRLGQEQSPGEHLREMMYSLDRSGSWTGQLASVAANGLEFWSTVMIAQVSDEPAGELWVSVYLP
jgi:PAS domain S-box-containing protein